MLGTVNIINPLGLILSCVFCVVFMFQGCTKGPHNKEKPLEPVKPEVKISGEKKELEDLKPRFDEYIIQAPKPLELIQRPR